MVEPGHGWRQAALMRAQPWGSWKWVRGGAWARVCKRGKGWCPALPSPGPGSSSMLQLPPPPELPAVDSAPQPLLQGDGWGLSHAFVCTPAGRGWLPSASPWRPCPPEPVRALRPVPRSATVTAGQSPCTLALSRPPSGLLSPAGPLSRWTGQVALVTVLTRQTGPGDPSPLFRPQAWG